MIVASDYFTVDSCNLKRLYVLFFMELDTRRIVWFGVTGKPNQKWVGQQARNLTLDAPGAMFRSQVPDL